MEPIITREQLQTAAVRCNEQEQHVEILQLSLIPTLSDEWKERATVWASVAIQQLQQDAVYLDGLLEQHDEGVPVVVNSLPQTPIEYNRLFALERYQEQIDKPEFAIYYKFSDNDVSLLDLLLQDPRVDPSMGDNQAIREASGKGHLAVVDRLLQDPRVNPSADNNEAIRVASSYGHLAVVDRLLQDPVPSDPFRGDSRPSIRRDVDPSAYGNCAIREASENGHLAVVDRLLQDPRVDPSLWDNQAIRLASEFGHIDVVERLLQDARVDPSVSHNLAIRLASENYYISVVERLIQDPRVFNCLSQSDIDRFQEHLAPHKLRTP